MPLIREKTLAGFALGSGGQGVEFRNLDGTGVRTQNTMMTVLFIGLPPWNSLVFSGLRKIN
jgi:hypothetical protein